MTENKLEEPTFTTNKSELKEKDAQKLFYVHIPQDPNVNSPRVLLKTNRGTTGPAQLMPLNTKGSSNLPAANNTSLYCSEEEKDTVQSDGTVNMSKISNFSGKSSGSTITVPLQGLSTNMSSIRNAPSKNLLPIRSVVKAPIKVSLANNRTVATVIRSSSNALSTMTRSTATTTLASGATITFVSSTNTPISANQMKSSSAASVQNRTSVPNKAVVSYGSFLHPKTSTGLSIEPHVQSAAKKESPTLKSPKKEGYLNSFTPPPLILQAGSAAAKKAFSNKNPLTTFNIVKGKTGSISSNMNVLPISRIQNSKQNMINFKITNGQIQNENGSLKLDGLLSEQRPLPNILLEAQHQKVSSSNFIKMSNILQKNKLPTNTDNKKDILQEAISAVSADASEEKASQSVSQTKTSIKNETPESPRKSTTDVRKAIPVVVTRPRSSSGGGASIIPVVMPVSSGEDVVPVVVTRTSSVSCMKEVPISLTNPAVNLNTTSDVSSERALDTTTPPNHSANFKEIQDMGSKHFTMDPVKDSEPSAANDNSEEMSCMELMSNEILSPEATETESDEKDNTAEESNEIEQEKLKELLNWENGTGSLSGTELKFRCNEFEAIELVENKTVEDIKDQIEELNKSPTVEKEKSVVQHTHHARKPSFKGLIKDEDDQNNDTESAGKGKDFYDICCCKSCGCYGLSSEFHKTKDNSFCTIACSLDYEQKEIEWNKEKLRLEKQKQRLKKTKLEKEAKIIKEEEIKEPKPKEIDTKGEITTEPIKYQHPWRDNKNCFLWVRYLEHCTKNKSSQSRGAPIKLWCDPFPFAKNLFRPGMKLEGIDPCHQSLFCVMTIADIIGFRIRLHFDGYSDMYDFWCNADSPFIFQAGWCEKNGRKLETPPGVVNFTWKSYLEHCKAVSAPRQAFTAKTTSAILPNNFRVGMKLEAEDRKNGWTCVATVSDILDNRILVHYDGWDKGFDTWFEVTSPFIHPVGWCKENNVQLYPPKDCFNADSFLWHEYLQETNSMPVPARAFKTRSPKEFKIEMKIEAVDQRNSMLIRVATITEIKNYQLKIHFDGWEDSYDYWIDDDSPDIHPPSWCNKTGHPLQPPLTPEQCAEDVDSGMGCGTPGCKGFGHIKGFIYNTHHTAYGCPYSAQNLNKDMEYLIPDRLEPPPDKKKSKAAKKVLNLDTSKPDPKDIDDDTQKKRVRKRRRFFDELSPPENVRPKMPKVSVEESIKTLSTSTKLSFASPVPTSSFTTTCQTTPLITSKIPDPTTTIPVSSSVLRSQETTNGESPKPKKELGIDTAIHQSVFNPSYNPKPEPATPHSWKQHRKIFLPLKDLQKLKERRCTIDDVRVLVSKIPGCEFAASRLVAQEVDGEALLLMTQNDLIELLQIKLGPAIKLMNLILLVRNL